MPEVYAHVLVRMVDKGDAPHTAVQKLQENLAEHGRSALLPKIAHAFERLMQKRRQKTDVRLFVAHHDDARHAKGEAEHALGSTHEHMHVHTDTSLVGGWRVEAGERLVDMTYKKQLLSIFNRATQ